MRRNIVSKTPSRKGLITQAVILAGGRGSRLAPFSHALPKPLMPVGDTPIIELVVRRLAKAGVRDIIVAVGAGAKLIELFLGDGSAFGVRIRYARERSPLGTVGPLRRMVGLHKSFFVLNGDILTDLPFIKMARAHGLSGAELTIGACERKETTLYGVIESRAGRVVAYHEKPVRRFQVSMGVYVFTRSVLKEIPKGRFDFPDLVRRLLDQNRPPHLFSHSGAWFDIGRPDDWLTADKAYRKNSARFS